MPQRNQLKQPASDPPHVGGGRHGIQHLAFLATETSSSDSSISSSRALEREKVERIGLEADVAKDVAHPSKLRGQVHAVAAQVDHLRATHASEDLAQRTEAEEGSSSCRASVDAKSLRMFQLARHPIHAPRPDRTVR